MEAWDPRFLPLHALKTALVLCGFAWCSAQAEAASWSGGGGFDYQTGPNDQIWRGALGFVSAEARGGDLTLAVIRYDDSLVGKGFTGFLNAGIPLTSSVHLRAIGHRAIGDEAYRAWRVKAGPELTLGGGSMVGAYVSHFEDNASSRLNLIGTEAALPVTTRLVGSGDVSYGEWAGGARVLQGAAGFVWSPARRLQILAQLGLGRNAVSLTSTASTGGGLVHLPFTQDVGGRGGGTERSSSQNEVATTGLAGFRVVIP